MNFHLLLFVYIPTHRSIRLGSHINPLLFQDAHKEHHLLISEMAETPSNEGLSKEQKKERLRQLRIWLADFWMF